MRSLRVGLIGLGEVAELHLRAYEEVEGIEVVAGADPRPERVAAAAGRWGFRGYADHREMLDAEPLDVACVLTPAASHAKVTLDAARHHVHVLCEKPIALTLDDAAAMIATCRAEGVALFYGSSYRFMPPVMKARDLVRQGRLGTVTLLVEVLVGGRGRRRYQELGPEHYPGGGPGGGGMGLVDHGIHLMDIFPWLAGAAVESVVGRGNTSGVAPGPEFLAMTLANGAVAHLVYDEATFASDRPEEGMLSRGTGWDVQGRPVQAGSWDDHPQSLRVHGDEGALRIFHYANRLFYFAEGVREEVPVPDRPVPSNFAAQMQSFARSIRRGEEPEVTGADGMNALRVLLAAYESGRTGRIVSLASRGDDDLRVD